MLESFLIIINQVAVLFILIAIGFLLRKVNLLEEKGVKGITNVVLYAVTYWYKLLLLSYTYDG